MTKKEIKHATLKPKGESVETLPLKALGLQIVDLEVRKRTNLNSREIMINYSTSKKWVTINRTLSQKIYENHFDHLILATGKDNSDIMLLFNRSEGSKVCFMDPDIRKSATICTNNLVNKLMSLLKIPAKIGSYIRNIELLNDNQDFLMIKVS